MTPQTTINSSENGSKQIMTNKTLLRSRQYHISHTFLVFIAGSFVALLCYELAPQLNGLMRNKPKLQHLPSESLLQARDDSELLTHLQQMQIWVKEFAGGTAVAQTGSAEISIDAETNIKEALSSLRLAQEMRFSGKDDKAQRLFEHAHALAPRHPEVLLRYGEYLEHNQRDIVLADQYYFQALTINPSNQEAMANRQRTAHIVQSIDENRLQALAKKRDALSALPETHAALRRAKKEAYFQHIYHSVGIEGNTMNLAQTRQILETRMAVDGKSIDEHNEILGLDAAMKFINATLVNK